MKLPGSHRPVKGKCGAKLIKESSPHLKPINKIPRLIRTATAVIVAGGLAVMVLSAQDDLDTVRQAAEQGDADAQFNLGNMYGSSGKWGGAASQRQAMETAALCKPWKNK